MRISFSILLTAIIILISCNPQKPNLLSAEMGGDIEKHFTKEEIKELEKVLAFFEKEVCDCVKTDYEDLENCYQGYFEKMVENEKTGVLNTCISPEKQKAFFENMNRAFFFEIWNIYEGVKLPQKPGQEKEMIPVLGWSRGKYLKYLKDISRGDHKIEQYITWFESVHDISPSMIADLIINYKEYDIQKTEIRLMIAIHYMTLTDENKGLTVPDFK